MVIEGQGRQFIGRAEFDRGIFFQQRPRHQRVVNDADRPAARVAGRAGKGIQLLQIRRVEADLAANHPPDRRLGVGVFLRVHETARQREQPLERRVLAPGEDQG